MSKKTKKIIIVVLTVIIIFSFFYTRIAKNIEVKRNDQEERVDVVNEGELKTESQEENKRDEEKQDPLSIELKKPPFIK
jgi:hypothetical protein